MSTPDPTRPWADPTVRLERPPTPGGTRPAPAARPPRPAHPDDESTIDIPRRAPSIRQRTLKFGTPEPVIVTVTARQRPRRRFRTWPWIAAVVVALVLLGAVLLVMLLRGATVEDRLGSPGAATPALPTSSVAPTA